MIQAEGDEATTYDLRSLSAKIGVRKSTGTRTPANPGTPKSKREPKPEELSGKTASAVEAGHG